MTLIATTEHAGLMDRVAEHFPEEYGSWLDEMDDGGDSPRCRLASTSSAWPTLQPKRSSTRTSLEQEKGPASIPATQRTRWTPSGTQDTPGCPQPTTAPPSGRKTRRPEYL
jgi:hypothetical protein